MGIILDKIMKTWNSAVKTFPNWSSLHQPTTIFCFCGITDC